jgi:hypothetical protein
MADEQDDAAAALELFTDPMCNIFGTFCLIVILLAFLSMIRARTAPSSALPSPPSAAAELRDQARELNSLREQLAAASTPDGREKLERVVALERALERRQAIRDEAVRREDAAAAELLQTPDLDSGLKAMLPQLRRDIERLRRAIADAEARSTMKLDLPAAHKVPGAGAGAIIIAGGRAHLVMRMPESAASQDACESLGLFDPESIDVAASHLECGRSGAIQHVKLRPDGGVDLRVQAWQDSARWKSWAAGMRSVTKTRRLVLYIHVATDSHAEFPALRSALIDAGVDYGIEMQDAPWDLTWFWGDPVAQ